MGPRTLRWRRMRLTTVAVGTCFSVGLAGCEAITGNEPTTGNEPIIGDEIRRERRPAWMKFYSDPIVIEVPNAVSRGVDFEVRVRTYGGGCIAQGDTEVTLSERHAEVRPFDVFVTHLPRHMACTSELRRYVHRASLRFELAGTATVRFHGRSGPGGETLVVERQVTVQ